MFLPAEQKAQKVKPQQFCAKRNQQKPFDAADDAMVFIGANGCLGADRPGASMNADADADTNAPLGVPREVGSSQVAISHRYA